MRERKHPIHQDSRFWFDRLLSFFLNVNGYKPSPSNHFSENWFFMMANCLVNHHKSTSNASTCFLTWDHCYCSGVLFLQERGGGRFPQKWFVLWFPGLQGLHLHILHEIHVLKKIILCPFIDFTLHINSEKVRFLLKYFGPWLWILVGCIFITISFSSQQCPLYQKQNHPAEIVFVRSKCSPH